MSLKEKVGSLLEELDDKFIEREELIRLLVLAVLSKEHLFMVGKPGVAKSYLARIMGSIVRDTRYFEYLINENVKYEDIFTEDKSSVRYCHFAFMDELYKCESNTAILNAFLQMLNERIFTKGFETEHLPLITMIGASNELPSSGSLGAFDDRLIFRYEVSRIQSRDNFIKFLKNDFDKSKEINNSFSIDEINRIKEESKNIKLSEKILNLLYEIDGAMSKQQAEISNRKMGKALDILKISAYLNDRTEIDYSDLFLLLHIFWQNYKEKERINILIPRLIYGSRTALENEIIAINEGLNFLKGRIASKEGFLSYKEELICEEHEQEMQYSYILDHVAAYCIGVENTQEYDGFLGLAQYIDRLIRLIEQHEHIAFVEKQIDDNIFLIGPYSSVFNDGVFEDINKTLLETKNEFARLENFVFSNQHYREYLNNKYKANERGLINAEQHSLVG